MVSVVRVSGRSLRNNFKKRTHRQQPPPTFSSFPCTYFMCSESSQMLCPAALVGARVFIYIYIYIYISLAPHLEVQQQIYLDARFLILVEYISSATSAAFIATIDIVDNIIIIVVIIFLALTTRFWHRDLQRGTTTHTFSLFSSLFFRSSIFFFLLGKWCVCVHVCATCKVSLCKYGEKLSWSYLPKFLVLRT